MNLPSFDEFISTLCEEDFTNMVKSDTIQMVTIPRNATDKELQLFITKLMTQSGIISMNATIKLLHKYHDWLSSQI